MYGFVSYDCVISHREHTKPQVTGRSATGCRKASTVCSPRLLHSSVGEVCEDLKDSEPSAVTSLRLSSHVIDLLGHSCCFWRSGDSSAQVRGAAAEGFR